MSLNQMSSSTSNSRKSFKYPSENFVLDILHLAEDMFCRKKIWIFDPARTDFYIVLLILMMDGSLHKTNYNFETPCYTWKDWRLWDKTYSRAGFFAVRLHPKRAHILTQLAADIFVVMASKNRKQLTDKRVYVHYVIWRCLVICETVTAGTGRSHQMVNLKGTTVLHPNTSWFVTALI